MASAESLPLGPSSTNLIVAMTAAHWFDLEKFYVECRRVLATDGVIVLGVNSAM